MFTPLAITTFDLRLFVLLRETLECRGGVEEADIFLKLSGPCDPRANGGHDFTWGAEISQLVPRQHMAMKLLPALTTERPG